MRKLLRCLAPGQTAQIPTAKLFSADTIQAQSKARGIVTSANGKTYIVTGALARQRRPLHPGARMHPGRGARSASPATANVRRTERRKELERMVLQREIVKCKGVGWIMLGRDVRFVEEAQTRETQMELF